MEEQGRRQQERRDWYPPHNIRADAMSKALCQISCSPFSHYIKDSKLPRHFVWPAFVNYNGKTDLVKHVDHINQSTAIYSNNEALMCKDFSSDLKPTAIRCFDGLEEGLIRLNEKLTRAIGARFVTCNWVPKPIDSLLTTIMKERESLRAYLNGYLELYNEI